MGRSLEWFNHAFGWVKNGVKFPKWHSTFHYYHFIVEYGVAYNTYSSWWEKAHRVMLKMPYLRTGRRVQDLERLLLLRLQLADVVRQKKSIMDHMYSVSQYDWKRQMGLDGKTSMQLIRRDVHTPIEEDAVESLTGRDRTGYVTFLEE